jgi:acyl-CoA thioester hydrolase
MTSSHKIFNYSVLIKEHHLDTFGHVNNAQYLALLEEARWEFLQEQGIDVNTIHKTGIGPVVLECHIQFLKELTLRQSIRIESQLLSFDKKIGIMRQDIINSHNELCSKAKMTFGVFDLNTRKLILPTTEWLSALGTLPSICNNTSDSLRQEITMPVQHTD